MSDLVGNPEDRFSQNEAHLNGDFRKQIANLVSSYCYDAEFLDECLRANNADPEEQSDQSLHCLYSEPYSSAPHIKC